MAQKTSKSKKSAQQLNDEHEQLEQEYFGWLSNVHDMLSPYWSARMEYGSDSGSRNR